MNSVFEYIKYRWNAKGRHAVHSPFVYEMLDKCFKISLDPLFLNEITQLGVKLKQDKRKIQVLDAGAGSRHFGKERRVSDIYKVSSSKGFNGLLLFRLAKHYQPKRILEFGTSLGIGTLYLSKGAPDSEIVTVEACPETLVIAKENFINHTCANIESINATFDHFLDAYVGSEFDLIFVDGHHDGKALLNYMKRLEKISHEETIFVLDDIRWSESMKLAFDTLVKSDQFHVTIDLFRTGIVLRRTQQIKEHFILKSNGSLNPFR